MLVQILLGVGVAAIITPETKDATSGSVWCASYDVSSATFGFTGLDAAMLIVALIFSIQPLTLVFTEYASNAGFQTVWFREFRREVAFVSLHLMCAAHHVCRVEAAAVNCPLLFGRSLGPASGPAATRSLAPTVAAVLLNLRGGCSR